MGPVKFWKTAFKKFEVIWSAPNLTLEALHIVTWNLLEYICHASRIIILSGDIETNRSPKHSFSSQGLTICHWNLNSLSSHMFKKVSLLSAHISVHKFDIICLSGISLNSETSCDVSNLEIPGYNFVTDDHPSNTKFGGVCV